MLPQNLKPPAHLGSLLPGESFQGLFDTKVKDELGYQDLAELQVVENLNVGHMTLKLIPN